MSDGALKRGGSGVLYGSVETPITDINRFLFVVYKNLFIFDFSRTSVVQPISFLKIVFDGVSLVIGMIFISCSNYYFFVFENSTRNMVII
jgi:hypothetical protein